MLRIVIIIVLIVAAAAIVVITYMSNLASSATGETHWKQWWPILISVVLLSVAYFLIWWIT